MGLRNVTDSDAVLRALDEFDARGRDAFLKKYGFGKAHSYFLKHQDRRYDSKAIVGAAHGFQHGDPLGPKDFSGGARTVVPVLKALGFVVVCDSRTLL